MDIILKKGVTISEVVGDILDSVKDVNFRLVISSQNNASLYVYKMDEKTFNDLIKRLFEIRKVRALVVRKQMILREDIEDNNVKSNNSKRSKK